MNLFVRPAAAAELEEANDGYEGQRLGLGDELLSEVQTVLREIVESPRRHSVVHRDTRRALVKRFPFAVFYRVVDADVIVVAFFHGRRDPRMWEARD